MFALLLVIIVLYLTFIAPWWLKIVLITANIYLPDVIPFVDEIIQTYMLFNSSRSTKFLKFSNTIRKLRK